MLISTFDQHGTTQSWCIVHASFEIMKVLCLLLLLCTNLFSCSSVVRKESALITALTDPNLTATDLNSIMDAHPDLLFVKDESGRLPTTIAYESGNLQAFTRLVARSAPIEDDTGNLIHRSIMDKEKYIFFQVICTNKSYDFNAVDHKTGLTPLMVAVMFNNRTAGFKLMDSLKVAVEISNAKDNKTALQYAIQFRVQWMLDRFGSPEPKLISGVLKRKTKILTPDQYCNALVRNDETLIDDQIRYVFVDNIGFHEDAQTWLQRVIALAEAATAALFTEN